MRAPPTNFTPALDDKEFRNGEAARALHARELDRYATYLACRKPQHPVVIGKYMEAGTTYKISQWIPTYTEHVRLGFLCSGSGYIVTDITGDTYNTKILVEAGDGTSGAHSVAGAHWVVQDLPIATPSANNVNRSHSVSFASAPHRVAAEWTITDTSGSKSLRVYSVSLIPLWPGEVNQLPV